MALFYLVTLAIVAVVAIPLLGIILWGRTSKSSESAVWPHEEGQRRAASVRRRFLAGWYFCVAAEWIEGPFVYRLYSQYGLSNTDIVYLLVASCASGLLFGTMIAALADRLGRRLCCQVYCGFLIVACLTKHVNRYRVLFFGHILGGISTTLLFSVFEAWLVGERTMLRLSKEDLHQGFMFMWCGSGATAILACLCSLGISEMTTMAPWHEGGVVFWGGAVAPFDLAALFLLIGFFIISFLWNENFGYSADEGSNYASTWDLARGAVWKTWTKRDVWLCGCIVACFEAATYCFATYWERSLVHQLWGPPPHGTAFTTLMLAMMCGVVAFQVARAKMNLPIFGCCVMFAAALALATPAILLAVDLSVPNVGTVPANLWCYLLFESCIGAYLPTISCLKSEYVGEEVRAATYCLYRVPLDIFVLCVLLSGFSIHASYAVSSCLTVAAGLFFASLAGLRPWKGVRDYFFFGGSCAEERREADDYSKHTLAERSDGQSYGALASYNGGGYAPPTTGGEGPLPAFGSPK